MSGGTAIVSGTVAKIRSSLPSTAGKRATETLGNRRSAFSTKIEQKIDENA
jgi:hypothetical protein